jgi:DNA polymerase I-like protein with 3'-5' exonuclease and polymerase domains
LLTRKDVSFKDGALRPNTLFNQLVQGFSDDGMKAALVVFQKRLDGLDAELVSVIHDEVIVHTPLCKSGTGYRAAGNDRRDADFR